MPNASARTNALDRGVVVDAPSLSTKRKRQLWAPNLCLRQTDTNREEPLLFIGPPPALFNTPFLAFGGRLVIAPTSGESSRSCICIECERERVPDGREGWRAEEGTNSVEREMRIGEDTPHRSRSTQTWWWRVIVPPNTARLELYYTRLVSSHSPTGVFATSRPHPSRLREIQPVSSSNVKQRR